MATTSQQTNEDVDFDSEDDSESQNQNTQSSDENTDSVEDSQDDSHTFELVAEGEATRHRGRDTESLYMDVQDTVDVEIRRTFSVEDMQEMFLKKGRMGLCLQSTIEHNIRSTFHDCVQEELAKNSCEVGYQDFKEWDVSFDGDVRAWLELLDSHQSPSMAAEKIAAHDECGQGLDAAVLELERRE